MKEFPHGKSFIDIFKGLALNLLSLYKPLELKVPFGREVALCKRLAGKKLSYNSIYNYFKIKIKLK